MGGEAGVAVHAFDELAEYKESKAVEEEVYESSVQEHGSEETPIFAGGNEWAEHRAEAQQYAHVRVDGAGSQLHEQPDDDVDGEEQPGYDGVAICAGKH